MGTASSPASQSGSDKTTAVIPVDATSVVQCSDSFDLEKIDQLCVPTSRLSPEKLYVDTIKAMYDATRYEGTPNAHDLVRRVEFAGQLLSHPSTFEFAAADLEACYTEAVADKDPNQHQTVTEIVRQMGKHPDLRQRALEIVFSARSHGIEDPVEFAGFESLKRKFHTILKGTAKQLAAKSVLLPEPEFLASESANDGKNLKEAQPVALQAHAGKFLIFDPATIHSVRNLLSELVLSIGDSDERLSNQLLDTFMKLRHLEIDGSEALQNNWRHSIYQDVREFASFKDLRPKLAKIIAAVHDREDQGNAYFAMFRKCAADGDVAGALKMLAKAWIISHAIYNEEFAKTSADFDSRASTLKHIRRIGGEQEVQRLAVVAKSAFECGAVKEAQNIYAEAWIKSKRSEKSGLESEHHHHHVNIAESFIAASRKSGARFDGMDADQLLSAARQSAFTELGGVASEEHCDLWLTRFTWGVIFELSQSGLYVEAESLVSLLYEKTKSQRFDRGADSARSEERDRGYMQMAFGAAHRRDFPKLGEYLSKMIEYKPEAMIALTKILGAMGEFKFSFIASVLSAQQLEKRDGFSRDRGHVGGAVRLLSLDKGDALFELGKAMLTRGVEAERVGKTFLFAAKAGLGNLSLQKLVDTIKKTESLRDYLVPVLAEALRNNPSRNKHHQHAVILDTLIETFPDLVKLDPNNAAVPQP